MQNFGKIKNIFNDLLVEGIANKTNENKAVFSKFVKTIRESDILKTQFNIYYDIEKKVEPSEYKSYEFVKESIGLMKKFKRNDIISENQKLIDILKNNKINYNENKVYPNDNLYENISSLIFKNNYKGIDGSIEQLGVVVDYVKENSIKVVGSNDFLPNSFVGNLMVEKFNAKYTELTDDEKSLLKTIVEGNSNDRKKLLENLSNECVGLVNNRLIESNDTTEKEALLNVKEVLLTLEYTDDTFISNIGKIIELKKAFDV